MVDFTEIVPVVPILEKSRIDWKGKNFEEVYSLLSESAELATVKRELEGAVFNYFSNLRLPESPTLYDKLVLSLRQKDVIATFNWDPFLIQALKRCSRVTDSLPMPLFLHGNVAHGYCERDSFQGPRGGICFRCGESLHDDKLLFPVRKKDYSSDPSIRKAWEVFRLALRDCLAVTIFGYAAPASDEDAVAIMSEAWGSPEKRQFETLEMIDLKSRDELRENWKRFIFSGHYRVHSDFSKSMLGNHPRRSGEAFLNQYMHGMFLAGNPIAPAGTLDELFEWFQPLIRAEHDEPSSQNPTSSLTSS